jgi:NAD-dependent deacetylase
MEELTRIRASLTTSTRMAALTGAGISASSGIPTFRANEGSLWHDHRPEDLATPAAFDRDPELVWRWYDWRRGLIAAAAPNAAHLALARLERSVAAVTVITQNVDGLHAAAGSGRISGPILEYHGSIWRTRCTECGREREDRRVPLRPPLPPRCEKCGGLLRPGVVWFGEPIDPAVHAAADAAARACDLFLVIGTSGVVWPAAGLARLARASGAQVLEFNLAGAGIGHDVDLFVPGDAAVTLPLLVP